MDNELPIDAILEARVKINIMITNQWSASGALSTTASRT